ncbi:MAG: hypothetical protein QMC77_01065 [Methanocellales archaeon]|nr:hypothetical protein [Methanocellales archaeon]
MTTAAVEMSEKQMLTLILEKLDRIELELSELRYPEEELIKEDFIESVEKASKRAKEGKVRRYSAEEFKEEFL